MAGDGRRCPAAPAAGCPGSGRGPSSGRRRRRRTPRSSRARCVGACEPGDGIALGRRHGRGGGARRGRRRSSVVVPAVVVGWSAVVVVVVASAWPRRRRRTAARAVLGLAGLDAGAPELVADEGQQEEPGRDEHPPDAAHPPPPVPAPVVRPDGDVAPARGRSAEALITHSGEPIGSFRRRPVAGRSAGRTACIVAPRGRSVPWAAAYGTGDPPPRRRRACSAASRPWPAPTSTSRGARSSSCRGRTAPARPRCCGSCAGLLPVSRGRGRRPRRRPAADRRAVRPAVGLLGHDNGLYDDLTVAENVRFWGRTVGRQRRRGRRRPGPARPRRPAAPTSPVGRLSAGQRRRTALAALVARRPELWLLDEPHAGLDADGRDLLDDLIRDGRRGRRHRRGRLPRAGPGRAWPSARSRSPAAIGSSPARRRPPVGDPPARPTATVHRRRRHRPVGVVPC